MDAAEVRVGARVRELRGRVLVRAGCDLAAELEPEAQLARVELEGPVGEGVADAGALVAGRLARGDAVPGLLGLRHVLRSVEVGERDRVARADRGRAHAGGRRVLVGRVAALLVDEP